MNMDHDQEAMQARLAELKVDPPDPEAFEWSLRSALAQETNPSVAQSTGWQAWVRAHPLFSGTATGLLTALFVLYVGQHQTTELSPSQQTLPATAHTALDKTAPTAPGVEVVPPATAIPHRVPNKGVALIKFHFSSEVTVADVDMQVELPAGLKFWSKGKELEQNSVAWRGHLKAGENTFPVAIFAGKKGTYQVIATAEVDGQVIEHQVVIEVIEEA